MEWVVTAAIAAAAALVAFLLARMKSLRDELDRQKQAASSAQALVERADQKLRDTFQALAADALKDNRSSFFDLAKTSFERYRQPITETLHRLDQRLGHLERERIEAYSRLSEQVLALGATTNTLSRALRTPAVRGRRSEEHTSEHRSLRQTVRRA